jgi:hypothetical protein
LTVSGGHGSQQVTGGCPSAAAQVTATIGWQLRLNDGVRAAESRKEIDFVGEPLARTAAALTDT